MVFAIAAIVVLLFVLWGIISPQNLAETSTSLLNITTEKFGWFYLLATFSFLLFSIFLAFSRYGSIKLGEDDDVPQYSKKSWFAMLFSAGMGIGLVFWGAAEPLSHYIDPPQNASPQTAEAARLAMRYSFFHWGLHAWAIYTVIGLTIAYFTFRKKRSGLISSVFFPLIGEKADGPLGKAIDILAIIATIFGVATSLGLGTLQINGGLHSLTGLSNNFSTQLTIIVIVTILYLASATTGLDKGIKILSNANLSIAVVLLVFVLFVGPTSFIFDVFTTTIGSYLQNLVQMSLTLTPFSQGNWIKSWTLFYWAWWIAWAPFVGMFIARVSRGRTIKEFVLGVLLVPSLFGFLWFAVFGGTALNLELFHNGKIAEAAQTDVTSALFNTLQQLPLGNILSAIATLLIITFFITSADSATFVLGMLSSKGVQNPSTKIKLVWGLLQSSIAAVLLLSGGLQGLQTASIIAAAPFSIILAFMCYSLYLALQEEFMPRKKDDKSPPKAD
ncbi:glycine betaine uptake BCCT transporter [Desertivirga xinjiangensis]|uniref:glycine betaine uptake BCCT transporter n=1 Tax=Desertivirga xinjiangensis TaxID=539206 RepID=UPI0021089216|nr:BCCT family transporter [Pedobacter xinjiangensis]